MKEGFNLNVSRHARESTEKQLEDEERLFEEQSLEAQESSGFRSSDLEEENLSSDTFNTPKVITYSKAKNGVEVTNSPTNLERQNTKKRSVEDTFPSPTPGPTKTARRLQQPSMGDSFYTKPYKAKLVGLLEAQGEEIKELKKLVYSQVKELMELKSIIKGMAKDFLSTKVISKKHSPPWRLTLHCCTCQTAKQLRRRIQV